jgi:hypothetical protein
MFTVCVTLLINAAHAQSLDNSSNAQSSDSFVNYINDNMKFSIQHPSNWKVLDFSKFYPEVSFKIPDRQGPQRFETRLEISTVPVEAHPDTDTVPIENTTLELHFQQEVRAIQSDYDKKIIRQNKVTVAGNIGWKVEYTKFYYYTFNIFTIGNGNFYKLSFTDEESKVPETLPLAKKMVDSFRILK